MLNVAIIGCGAVVADLHVPAILRLRRSGVLRVAALVDPNRERANMLQREFPEAVVCDTAKQALAAGKVEVVLVASPPGLHEEHALGALAAGSHVLLEKPMADRVRSAENIAAAAERAEKALAIALPRRYFPCMAEVASLVRAGDLGDDLAFQYREGSAYDWQVATDAPFRRAVSGGGVLMDKGAHVLDTVEQIFGESEVLSARDDSLEGGVEANTVIELRCRLGRGTVQLSWDQALYNGLWITGSRGTVWVDLGEIETFRRREADGRWRVVRPEVSWPADTKPTPRRFVRPWGYHDCIFLEWVNFLRAVLLGAPPAVSGCAALGVMRTIEAAYAAAVPLDLPWLEAEERDRQRTSHWRAEP